MNTLESLVPSFKLCKLIPEGKFADSVLVWDPIELEVYERRVYDPEIAVPAPTLGEILAEFDILTIAYAKKDSTTHEMDENRKFSNSIGGLKDEDFNPFMDYPKYCLPIPTNAEGALKLWLKFHEIEADR